MDRNGPVILLQRGECSVGSLSTPTNIISIDFLHRDVTRSRVWSSQGQSRWSIQRHFSDHLCVMNNLANLSKYIGQADWWNGTKTGNHSHHRWLPHTNRKNPGPATKTLLLLLNSMICSAVSLLGGEREAGVCVMQVMTILPWSSILCRDVTVLTPHTATRSELMFCGGTSFPPAPANWVFTDIADYDSSPLQTESGTLLTQ